MYAFPLLTAAVQGSPEKGSGRSSPHTTPRPTTFLPLAFASTDRPIATVYWRRRRARAIWITPSQSWRMAPLPFRRIPNRQLASSSPRHVHRATIFFLRGRCCCFWLIGVVVGVWGEPGPRLFFLDTL